MILWLTAAFAVGGEGERERSTSTEKQSECQIRTNVCQVKRAAFSLMKET